MIKLDPKPITCGVCGIRHDGGPTGCGPCPRGHTMADEVKKSAGKKKKDQNRKYRK